MTPFGAEWLAVIWDIVARVMWLVAPLLSVVVAVGVVAMVLWAVWSAFQSLRSGGPLDG